MLERGMTCGLLMIGLGSAILAVGYFMQVPWALATWPWQDSRLSNIFVSSILSAVAAAMFWIGISRRLAGAAAGFLHVATMLGGSATVLLPLGLQRGQPSLTTPSVSLALAAVGCIGAFAWARRMPVVDTRALPTALRVWCILYLLILVPAGSALIGQVPGIMPWPIKPETSMIYGWVFVSAAWSFAYPLLRPQVEHIRVGLVGFLAYDAVLIVPFVRHLETVRPELLNSLLLYIVALTVSAGVSIHYLLISPDTRLVAPGNWGAGRHRAGKTKHRTPG